MKKIVSFIIVFALLFTACEGPQGPPGFDGPPGQNGVNFVGQSFERTIDFTSVNNYEQLIIIPNNIEVLETDMILVYLLWDENPDIWRLLPQTIYTSTGEEFQYNFDATFFDVNIFLDAPAGFDFNSLSSADTLGQTFRIVVLPVDLVNGSNIDVTNMNEVMNFVN